MASIFSIVGKNSPQNSHVVRVLNSQHEGTRMHAKRGRGRGRNSEMHWWIWWSMVKQHAIATRISCDVVPRRSNPSSSSSSSRSSLPAIFRGQISMGAPNQHELRRMMASRGTTREPLLPSSTSAIRPRAPAHRSFDWTTPSIRTITREENGSFSEKRKKKEGRGAFQSPSGRGRWAWRSARAAAHRKGPERARSPDTLSCPPRPGSLPPGTRPNNRWGTSEEREEERRWSDGARRWVTVHESIGGWEPVHVAAGGEAGITERMIRGWAGGFNQKGRQKETGSNKRAEWLGEGRGLSSSSFPPPPPLTGR